MLGANMQAECKPGPWEPEAFGPAARPHAWKAFAVVHSGMAEHLQSVATAYPSLFAAG